MKIHASHCPRTAGAYDRIYLYHFSTLVDSGGSVGVQQTKNVEVLPTIDTPSITTQSFVVVYKMDSFAPFC